MRDDPRQDTPANGAFAVTDLAREEILRLRGPDQRVFLRIWVEAGGCSGMSYHAALTDVPSPFDVPVFDDGALRVVTDRQSLPDVEALSVDYTDDLARAAAVEPEVTQAGCRPPARRSRSRSAVASPPAGGSSARIVPTPSASPSANQR